MARASLFGCSKKSVLIKGVNGSASFALLITLSLLRLCFGKPDQGLSFFALNGSCCAGNPNVFEGRSPRSVSIRRIAPEQDAEGNSGATGTHVL